MYRGHEFAWLSSDPGDEIILSVVVSLDLQDCPVWMTLSTLSAAHGTAQQWLLVWTVGSRGSRKSTDGIKDKSSKLSQMFCLLLLVCHVFASFSLRCGKEEINMPVGLFFLTSQSCKLKQQRASPPGCSFSFNNSVSHHQYTYITQKGMRACHLV